MLSITESGFGGDVVTGSKGLFGAGKYLLNLRNLLTLGMSGDTCRGDKQRTYAESVCEWPHPSFGNRIVAPEKPSRTSP